MKSVYDISERKRATESLKTYVADLVDVQEEEYHYLAQELHEGVIQLLGSTLHRIRAPAGMVSSYSAEELLVKAIDETRRITHRLRPSVLDHLGLNPAIRSLCSDFQNNCQKKMRVRVGEVNGRLNEKLELAVFRIAQEALANIEKHSGAENVTLELTVDTSNLSLTIADDGRGFNPEKCYKPLSGLGLRHIEERALSVGGSAVIESVPGNGTSIFIQVPVQFAAVEGNNT